MKVVFSFYFSLSFFPSFTTGTTGTCPSQLFITIFKLERKRERKIGRERRGGEGGGGGREGREEGREEGGREIRQRFFNVLLCSFLLFHLNTSYPKKNKNKKKKINTSYPVVGIIRRRYLSWETFDKEE